MNPIFFALIGYSVQFIIFILYIVFGKYKDFSDADFAIFEGVHLMIFMGFGFLYAFMKKFSWTGLGQNLLAGVFSLEFYFVLYWFWLYALDDSYTFKDYTINFSGLILLQAEFCAGAILVSFGALIGKVDTLQMMLLALFETFFYSLNEYAVGKIGAIDSGGGIILHTFGGYFGIAATWAFSPQGAKDHKLNETNYNSNLFAFIGTLVLWVYWPSFNAALSFAHPGNSQFNTYLGLLGSTTAVFLFSSLKNKGKFSIVSVVNATLSGGVALGTACERLEEPGVALMMGLVAGTISAFGFEILSKFLENKLNILDNAGIHNLHAMPGLFGAICSIFIYLGAGEDSQGLKQFYGILCTLAIAISTGVVFGLILRTMKSDISFYADKEHWVEISDSMSASKVSPLQGKLADE